LKPLLPGQDAGPDRYSEEVSISYGRYGFYFDEPGEYHVRALYQGAGDILIPSNVHRLRVGTPLTRELDKTAQDYFSYEVGMNLYLEGSRSPYLEKGFDLLREMSEKHKNSLLGAKLAMTVANSLTQPFFNLEETNKGDERLELRQTYKADPKEALKLTEAAVDVFQKADEKALNLSYRQLVSQRVDCLVQLERPKQAVKELDELHDHLQSTGANPPVLNQISNLAETIGSAPVDKIEEYSRHRLWERVRTHDQLASVAGLAEQLKPTRIPVKKKSSKARAATKKAAKKSRKSTKKSGK